MFKKHQTTIIILASLVLITVGIVWYVQYLLNQPLEIEPPAEFIYQNQTIPLAWTDDNTGETLIIQTDKKTYAGFNQAQVYFSITNISRRDQDMDIVFWFEDSERKVESISRLNGKGLAQVGGNTSKSALSSSPSSVEEGNEISRKGLPAQAGNKIARKPVNGYTAGQQTQDTIKSGQTNFYLATISYPPRSQGEFFIEALGTPPVLALLGLPPLIRGGTGRGYGHLDPWYSSSWLYRKAITINADQVATTTNNFPVLATTTLDTAKVRSDAYDIVFTQADGQTTLYYERELYDNSSGELVAWIKTDISSTTDTVLYMYYGNSGQSSDLATTTGVWDENYVLVQHLEESCATTSCIQDSTAYYNDGTPYSSTTITNLATSTGQIDGASEFDGSNDYVHCGSDSSLDDLGSVTISAWIYADNYGGAGGKDGAIILKGASFDTGSWLFWFDGWGSDLKFQKNYSGDDLTASINFFSSLFGAWQYVAVVWNGSSTASEVELYLNGVETSHSNDFDATGSKESDASRSLIIGARSGISEQFDGTIDEVRISSTTRSSGWIKTEYNNQSDVSSFMTFGAEEDNTPTEFVSTICQNTAAGGDCANMDYSRLYDWETAVECNLTPTTTRVFSGTLTGNLNHNDLVELYRNSTTTGISAYVIATTSDQILVATTTGSSIDLVAQSGDQWRYNDSTSTMWTIAGTTGNELGDTAIAVAKIDGAWSNADTQAVTIDDWTTSATNYIKIYTTDAARHNGTAGTGYVLEPSSASHGIQILEDYTRIEGIEVTNWNTGGTSGSYDGINIRADNVLIEYVIVHDGGSSRSSSIADENGITLEVGGSVTVTVRNSIVYNIGRSGITIHNVSAPTLNIENCTVYRASESSGESYGGVIMYGTSGTINAKNVIVMNTQGAPDFVNYGNNGSWGTSYNNLSSDSSAPGSDSLTNQSVADQFISITSDSEDLHLQTTSDAIDVGINLSGTFTDDIDGDYRFTPWDIGADEVAETPVEFVCTIMENSGDFQSLSSWEAAIDCDLTASTTRVYSFDTASGTIADAAAVTTDSGSSTATLLHQASSSQVLLIDINGEFNDNDVVCDTGCAHNVTLSNNGAPAIAVAKIDGAWTGAETSDVRIHSWTTSASNYIRIYTTTAARHDGKWNTNKYRIESTGEWWSAPINVAESYVYIEGLQINDTGSIGVGGIFTNGPYDQEGLFIFNNIIRCTGTCLDSSNQDGINLSGIAGLAQIKNNIVYGFSNSGGSYGMSLFQLYPKNGVNPVVYNNTVYGCYNGIRTDDDGYYYNNLSYNNSNADYTGETPKGSGNNLSKDATSPDTAYRNLSVNFANEANDDFHLAGSDDAAKDAGTDLSADSNLSFSDDIDGETRGAGGAWDIGADEKKRSTVIKKSSDKPHYGVEIDVDHSLADGLVAAWVMNEGNGDVVHDLSGNSQHAIGNAALSWCPTGLTWNGAKLDVSNESLILLGNSNYTIYFRGSLPSVSASWDSIIAWGGYSPVFTCKNGIMNFHTGGGDVFFGSQDIRDTGIRDLVFVRHGLGTNEVEGYLDGVFQGTGTSAGAFTGSVVIYDNGAGSYGWRGDMGHIFVYNRALSAEEIEWLHNEPYVMFMNKTILNSPITEWYTAGLVGHWTFNGQDMDWGSTTAEALDRSGQGNHGDVTNMSMKKSVTGGVVGQALEFDGEDDWVAIGSSAIITSYPFTICAWFKSSDMDNRQTIVSIADDTFDSRYWRLQLAGDVAGDPIRFIAAYGTGGSADTTTGYSANMWHHTCAVGVSAADRSVYIDGGSKGVNTDNYTPTGLDHTAIGRFDGLTKKQYMDGLIDEVRVYDRALSAEEIEQLYRVGARKVEIGQ